MKSEKCKLNGTAACADAALNETERFAVQCGLSAKKALHLRLLAEEMLGLMNGLLAVQDGVFWVQQTENNYEIHAQAHASPLSASSSKRLLEASTSGKNDCYQGISGKICQVLDWIITQRSSNESDEPLVFDAQRQRILQDPYAKKMSDQLAASDSVQWSFSQYIANEKPNPEDVQWDELERSVLSNLADDIRIGVRGNEVFVTVCWDDDEMWSMIKKLKKYVKE